MTPVHSGRHDAWDTIPMPALYCLLLLYSRQAKREMEAEFCSEFADAGSGPRCSSRTPCGP